MTLDEMKAHLAVHGVAPETLYTIGGLGGGDIDGIECIDGTWYTYFSERGAKNAYRAWPNEAEAVAYIAHRTEALARQYGMWTEAP